MEPSKGCGYRQMKFKLTVKWGSTSDVAASGDDKILRTVATKQVILASTKIELNRKSSGVTPPECDAPAGTIVLLLGLDFEEG
jgi:hypothetical protein